MSNYATIPVRVIATTSTATTTTTTTIRTLKITTKLIVTLPKRTFRAGKE